MKKDRFFGFHMDFHAKNDCEIGTRTNPEDLEWYINQMHPDFIQCDCKGHPGNSCYPTKVGKAADLLKSDNLKVFCETAKKHNIPIYVHYSGLWDMDYANSFSENRVVNTENHGAMYDTGVCSVFGDFYEKRFIPQAIELIDNYGIDGMWIDGDCWSVCKDFSEKANANIPKNASNDERCEIIRLAYMKKFKKYVDAIHAHKPDFSIINNWAYSSFMPEKPEIDVDFLSGDFCGVPAMNEGRFDARVLSVQGKKWDLMSWSCHLIFLVPEGSFPYCKKSAPQLMQEAAFPISLGGGYQFVFPQNNDGSVRVVKDNVFKELADFVHKRRFLYGKKPLAQIALFISAESQYKLANTSNSGKMYNSANATAPFLQGMLRCILDSQYTAGVVLDYQLDLLSGYDIAVIPQWCYISEERKEKFVEYSKNGGKLVIVGTELCKQFEKLTENEFGDIVKNANRFVLANDEILTQVKGDILDLKQGDGKTYFNYDLRDEACTPAYKIQDFGKGKIVFIPFNFGDSYSEAPISPLCNFLKGIINKISTPEIKISKQYIDLTMQEFDGGIYVNLINTINPHVPVFDYIPPICDIDLEIKGSFSEVTMPFGEEFSHIIEPDRIKLHLSRLDIHSVIELKNQSQYR